MTPNQHTETAAGNPLFSVVTPSYNQGQYIEQTICSVLAQECDSFEHIVIDGGSTDNTVDVLKKFPHLNWISERDSGQSEALNKGLRRARGEIIAWVNSDDYYEPCVFGEIAEFFKNNPDKNVVMGDCNFVDGAGKVFNHVVNEERGYRKLRKYWRSRAIPTQPAIFFRRKLLDECGYADESLHYGMDYDLWLRFAKKNRFYHLDLLVANYRFHPSSKGGTEDWSKFRAEWRVIYNRYNCRFSFGRWLASFKGRA